MWDQAGEVETPTYHDLPRFIWIFEQYHVVIGQLGVFVGCHEVWKENLISNIYIKIY